MLLSNNECWPFEIYLYKMDNVMSPPPTCIIIPLHAKVVTKVVNPTSTPSHCSRLSCYDRCIMAFVNAKGCIEHVSDKEEEIMEDG